MLCSSPTIAMSESSKILPCLRRRCLIIPTLTSARLGYCTLRLNLSRAVLWIWPSWPTLVLLHKVGDLGLAHVGLGHEMFDLGADGGAKRLLVRGKIAMVLESMIGGNVHHHVFLAFIGGDPK